jgi:hypothetical protein
MMIPTIAMIVQTKVVSTQISATQRMIIPTRILTILTMITQTRRTQTKMKMNTIIRIDALSVMIAWIAALTHVSIAVMRGAGAVSVVASIVVTFVIRAVVA